MLIDKAVFVPGNPTVVESTSARQEFGAVFEDDGDTGYFYALEFERVGNPIVDALHIYDVKQFSRQNGVLTVLIQWSDAGTAARLSVNGDEVGSFDFAARSGRCRSNFPPPIGDWRRADWPG